VARFSLLSCSIGPFGYELNCSSPLISMRFGYVRTAATLLHQEANLIFFYNFNANPLKT